MNALSAIPFDTALQLLVPVGVLALVIFFWFRTGTLHSVMERLWRLLAGNSPTRDPQLASFIDETRELERFRFIYGLRIERKEDLRKFLNWRQQHRLPIGTVQAMRNWFDIRKKIISVAPVMGSSSF